MPRVGVVIAAYNSAATLPRALESVARQTFDDWECLIVDDGSHDSTAAVARAWCRRDPRFRLIRSAQNEGSGPARNRGWRASTAEWVAILDADDAWQPEKLARQLHCVEAHPGAQWSFHGVRYVQEGLLLQARRPVVDHRFLECLLGTDDYVVHSSVLYRRSALESLGGFDPTLRRSQDWDLFLRLALRYGPAGACGLPEVLADYSVRPGAITPAIAAHGRRCQGRVIARMMVRPGWVARHPRLAWRLVDGYVDRLVEWSTALENRPAAFAWSLAAVVLAPARRWRWRRAVGWLKA